MESLIKVKKNLLSSLANMGDNTLEKSGRKQMQGELRHPGEGRSGCCAEYLMGDLFPLGWLQIQSAGGREPRQPNVRDEATESPPRFITLNRSSTIPFQSVITFEMLNKCNWCLEK